MIYMYVYSTLLKYSFSSVWKTKVQSSSFFGGRGSSETDLGKQVVKLRSENLSVFGCFPALCYITVISLTISLTRPVPSFVSHYKYLKKSLENAFFLLIA